MPKCRRSLIISIDSTAATLTMITPPALTSASSLINRITTVSYLSSQPVVP